MNDENLMNEEAEQTIEPADSSLDETAEAVEDIEAAAPEEEVIPKYDPEAAQVGLAESAPAKSNSVLATVYIALIAILVIAIIVLGILLGKKLTENKAGNDTADNSAVATTAPSDSTSGTASAGDTTATPATSIKVTYDVTTELGRYKGIEVEYPDVTVTDEEIEYELMAFLEDSSELIDVTGRAAQLGDTATIDYAGYLDGVAFDGGTDTDFDLELGSQTFIDGFEDGIVGHNIGDEFDLPLTFPENYNETLGGKDVIFKITVKGIKETVTPELTDEFVSANTDYATVDAYREYIREYLSEDKIAAADEEVNEKILEALVAGCTFGGQIEEEIAATVNDNKTYYDNMAQSYYGIDGQTLFYYFYGFSEEEYEEHIYKQSEASVKTRYALEKVAEAEGFTLTEEEFSDYFNKLFIDYYGYTSADEVYADYADLYTKEELDEQVTKSAILDNAQNFIIENANINK